MKKVSLAVSLAALALAACQQGGSNGGGGGQGGARDQIRVVGSSTVYPFATAVAEQFVRNNPSFKAPIVESTGTGAGMKLFCAGVGAGHPDIENASRRIKKSEFDDCRKNGVNNIVEVPIGIDGIAFIEGKNGAAMNLTQADIYRALAANPFGKGPNTAKTWKDVDPSLPAIAIRVYGPPPTSGTRDAFAELILEKGCESDPAMKALKEKDKDRHKDLCTKIREDGAYVEAGENDNLLVQKVAANEGAIGILGYSFLEENADKVRGITLAGVAPTAETISTFAYPGARPLYIYVKGEHLSAIPGIREYVAEFAKGWGPGGYLARRGLIASPADKLEAQAQAAKDLKPMTADGLK
ncbi:MAG: phosphate transport system substrate-binding protein [Sphingomonadales bacterium]|nr:phosphate transport system substrate-binding protein [Sphingomonadales bacterium]